MPGRGKQHSKRQSRRQQLIRKLDQIEAESRRRGVPAIVIIRVENGQYQVFEGIPRGLIDLPLDKR